MISESSINSDKKSFVHFAHYSFVTHEIIQCENPTKVANCQVISKAMTGNYRPCVNL